MGQGNLLSYFLPLSITLFPYSYRDRYRISEREGGVRVTVLKVIKCGLSAYMRATFSLFMNMGVPKKGGGGQEPQDPPGSAPVLVYMHVIL